MNIEEFKLTKNEISSLEQFMKFSIINNKIIKKDISFLKKVKNYLFKKNYIVAEKAYEKIWKEKELSNYFKEEPNWNTSYFQTQHLYKDKLIVSRKWVFNFYICYLLSIICRKNNFKTIAEIGSGNGINVIILAFLNNNFNITGLELTESGMISSKNAINNNIVLKNIKKMGQKLIKDEKIIKQNVNFYKKNIIENPFKKDQYDVIFSSLALEQIPDKTEKALNNMIYGAKSCIVLFEPFLEFNDFKKSRLIKNKGYMYKHFFELYENQYDVKMYNFPLKFNKVNFNAGITIIRK